MQIGAGSYLFRYAVGTDKVRPPHPLGPVELVERAAALGFDLVQFADNLPLHPYGEQVWNQTRETARKYGLTLEVGTAGTKPERMRQYLKIAKCLDAKLLRITPHASDTHPTREEAADAIREVLPAFREAGVAIAIENHFTMASEDLLWLVREIDDETVGICLDTANSIVQQEWPMETVRLLGDYAISLHMKDYKMSAHPDGVGVLIEGAPLGEGDQQIQAILDELQQRGKRLPLVLEQWMPPADSIEKTLQQEEAWIRQSVAHARNLL